MLARKIITFRPFRAFHPFESYPGLRGACPGLSHHAPLGLTATPKQFLTK